MQLLNAAIGDAVTATTATTGFGFGFARLAWSRDSVDDSGAVVVNLDPRHECANQLLALVPIERVETGADLRRERGQLARQGLQLSRLRKCCLGVLEFFFPPTNA